MYEAITLIVSATTLFATIYGILVMLWMRNEQNTPSLFLEVNTFQDENGHHVNLKMHNNGHKPINLIGWGFLNNRNQWCSRHVPGEHPFPKLLGPEQLNDFHASIRDEDVKQIENLRVKDRNGSYYAPTKLG